MRKKRVYKIRKTPCSVCGGKRFYVSKRTCVRCTRKKNKQDWANRKQIHPARRRRIVPDEWLVMGVAHYDNVTGRVL